MKEIQLRDAKATFSRVIDDAVAGETAVITRNGKRAAVIISYSEYERLSRVPSLGWLLTNSPLEDGDLPERGPARALRRSTKETSDRSAPSIRIRSGRSRPGS